MNKKSPKRMVSDIRNDISPYDFEGSLADLQVRICQWIEQYGPGARIDWDPNFHYSYDPDPSPRYNITVDREETDDEYKDRLAQEKKWQDDRDARDRAEFERLQKKFGE